MHLLQICYPGDLSAHASLGPRNVQGGEDPRVRVKFVPRSTARLWQHAETQTLGDETQTLASASASAFPAEAAVASGNTVPLEAMATYTVDYTGIPGHVYTLLLESGRFYAGWSSAVENRIAQQFSGAGSKWTIQHKPLQVLACVAGDTRLEDVATISLMCQHRWERVRGGRWCQKALEGPPDAVTRAMPPPRASARALQRACRDRRRAMQRLARQCAGRSAGRAAGSAGRARNDHAQAQQGRRRAARMAR